MKGIGRNAIIISAVILAFIAGTIVASPQVIAANPVLEQVLEIVLTNSEKLDSIELTLNPVCGDGIVSGDETCDDGADNGSYGFCNATCDDVLECGDDVVNGPEECDDGNTANGDGCSSVCLNESECSGQPPGTACGDFTDTECTNADTCDGAGNCVSNDEADGTTCGTGILEPVCNPDTCSSGVCTDVASAADGTQCGDGIADPICNPDVCSSGVCTDVASEPDFTACGGAIAEPICKPDICLNGTCDISPLAGVGVACSIGTCDGAGTCVP